MKKPEIKRGLTYCFYREAMRRPYSPLFIDRRRVCWLARFDPLHRPCEGRVEAFHFIGRQQIRNCPTLHGLHPDLVELAEWDDRNGGPGCELHHRGYDSHTAPRLIVPFAEVPLDTIECITEWGLESEAERRFSGELADALQPTFPLP